MKKLKLIFNLLFRKSIIKEELEPTLWYTNNKLTPIEVMKMANIEKSFPCEITLVNDVKVVPFTSGVPTKTDFHSIHMIESCAPNIISHLQYLGYNKFYLTYNFDNYSYILISTKIENTDESSKSL